MLWSEYEYYKNGILNFFLLFLLLKMYKSDNENTRYLNITGSNTGLILDSINTFTFLNIDRKMVLRHRSTIKIFLTLKIRSSNSNLIIYLYYTIDCCRTALIMQFINKSVIPWTARVLKLEWIMCINNNI